MAQSWLGRRVLAGQVRGLVAGVKETVVARLEDVFQQMWLNNGNRSGYGNNYNGDGNNGSDDAAA